MKPPTFRYYPDPVTNESVEVRDGTCSLCGEERTHFITGGCYGADLDFDEDDLCVWCVADGTAARHGASFNDLQAKVPPEVREEVEERTPGILSMQDWGWLTCCDDACVFLGMVDRERLEAHGPEAVAGYKADFLADLDYANRVAEGRFTPPPLQDPQSIAAFERIQNLSPEELEREVEQARWVQSEAYAKIASIGAPNISDEDREGFRAAQAFLRAYQHQQLTEGPSFKERLQAKIREKLGDAGLREVQRRFAAPSPEDEFAEHLNEISIDGEPTGYLFQCRHCGRFRGTWDMG